MTGRVREPHPGPRPLGRGDAAGSPDGSATDEMTVLEHQLRSGDGTWLARSTARVATATRLLAWLIVATGVLALAVGLGAWREEPIAMVVVIVLCLPAVVVPSYVARRTAALAEAAGHPREMAAQVQDLMTGIRDSAELRALAGRLARRRGSGPAATQAPTARAGRVRGALSLARLTSTVIGQASPDAERHPLLVPFTPERLGHTWLAVIWSLWAWLVAAIVLVVSLPVLAFGIV